MIVDFHIHLGRVVKGWIKALEKYGVTSEEQVEKNVEELVREMDKHKVDKAVVFPNPRLPVEYRDANDEIADAQKKYPDRIIGFCRVDPRDSERAIEELERSILSLELKGLKLHPVMEVFTPDHEYVVRIVKKAGELGVPVLIHSGVGNLDSPRRLYKLVEEARETTVIVGHFLSYPANVELAEKYDNVYLETSGVITPKIIELAVRKVGAEKILFGSDWPYLDMKFEMVKVEMARISREEKNMILGGNAKRILKL